MRLGIVDYWIFLEKTWFIVLNVYNQKSILFCNTKTMSTKVTTFRLEKQDYDFLDILSKEKKISKNKIIKSMIQRMKEERMRDKMQTWFDENWFDEEDISLADAGFEKDDLNF